MVLPDLNVLRYAYNPFTPQHARACAFWQAAVSDAELIVPPHEVTFGFVRSATNLRLGRAAVELAAARAVVAGWLALPQVRAAVPTAGHLERVMDLMERAMARGGLLSDAALAAYAIEHRATLITNGGDFARLPGLSWRNPLVA